MLAGEAGGRQTPNPQMPVWMDRRSPGGGGWIIAPGTVHPRRRAVDRPSSPELPSRRGEGTPTDVWMYICGNAQTHKGSWVVWCDISAPLDDLGAASGAARPGGVPSPPTLSTAPSANTPTRSDAGTSTRRTPSPLWRSVECAEGGGGVSGGRRAPAMAQAAPDRPSRRSPSRWGTSRCSASRRSGGVWDAQARRWSSRAAHAQELGWCRAVPRPQRQHANTHETWHARVLLYESVI